MTAGEILRRREFPYVVIACLGAVAVGLAAWHPLAALDTFSRYAVMAEAFAAGNWKDAFHPRFGVGFPCLSGSLRWLTGLDGYRCCAIVSTLAWAAGMIPLFRLTRRIFGETAAWFAVVLYAFCPQTLIWGLKGFRDTFRIVGVLFMVSGAVGRRLEPNRGLCEQLVGFSLLVLFRGDSVLQAVALLGVFACIDMFRHKTWLLAAGSAVIMQPSCWLVYSWTGCWCPVYEAVWILKRWLGG